MISGGVGWHGTARVDTYTFWKEIDSDTADPFEGELLLLLPKQNIGIWARCTREQEGETLTATAEISANGHIALRGEGKGERSDGSILWFHVVSRNEGDARWFNDPWSNLGFTATREALTFVDVDYVIRVDLVTVMDAGPNQPTHCTFSGTAELFRPG